MTEANGSAASDAWDRGFVHKVRPAAGLAPVDTAAPNSVFAIGGAAPSAAEPHRDASLTQRRSRAPSRRAQALETLKSRGPITVFQFAEAMELPVRVAGRLLSNMKAGGKISSTRDAAGLSLYTVTGQTPASTRSHAKALRPWKPAPVASPAPEVPPDPELACAIFNNGAMLLEVPNSPPLRLSPRQAGELISYLRTLQGGLR